VGPLGAGFWIRNIRKDLTNFQKNVISLSKVNGIIPARRDSADILKRKFDKYANVDADNAEFNELLRDVVAASSDLCRKCTLWATWKVFKQVGFPYVNASIVDDMKADVAMPLLRRYAEFMDVSVGARNDNLSAELYGSILSLLNSVPFGGKERTDWLDRYGRDPKTPLLSGAIAFARDMEALTPAHCPD